MLAKESRNDAMIARDRCLDALAGCTDLETRKSLWRAAMRYHERVLVSRRERAGLESRTPLADHALGMADTEASACLEFKF